MLEIGGIKLNVGTLAVPGDVRFAVNSASFGTACAAPNGSDSCAVATVSAVARRPRTTRSSSCRRPCPTRSPFAKAIAPISVKELRAGAIDSGGVCITLADPPEGTEFDTTATVGVTASGGTGEGTAANVIVTATSISFTTTLSTTATTYTVGGARLVPGDETGPVNADVTAGTCAAQPPPTTTTTAPTTTTMAPTTTTTGPTTTTTAPTTTTTAPTTTTTGPTTTTTGSTTTTTGSTTTTTEHVTTTTAPTTTTTACPNILICLLQGIGLGGASGASETAATTAAVSPAAALPAGTPYIRGIRLAYVGDVNRVSGPNRYATAQAIAHALGDLSDKTVVIASGDNFPDALAASYLAGQDESPILLTTPSSVPTATLQALAYGGATKVVLVGGVNSISNAVQTTLDNTHTYDFPATATSQPNDATLDVSRIGGADRYATAALVAENPGLDKAGTIGIADGTTCSNDVKQAIVASGETFPDALSAGGLAYGGVSDDGCGGGPIPLLLTPSGSVSPAAAIAIRDLGVKHVILMGGTATVSQAVENGLDSINGVTVTRVAGATRQETAVKLASLILGPDAIGAWNSGVFLVARPDTFPDALAASALSGGLFAPLYLANSSTELGAANSTAIVDYPQDYGRGVLIGGTTSLSDGVGTQVATAIASQP